jgi:hypothetical protein
VGAKDDVPVRAGELGYVELIQQDPRMQLRIKKSLPSGWVTMPAAVPLAPFTNPKGVLMLNRIVSGISLV